MTSHEETWHPQLHAHRGAYLRHPKKTMSASIGAWEEEADVIEFDVHATADGHLVVIHDYDLARTTSGKGVVHERDLAYVRSLSGGACFDEEFARRSSKKCSLFVVSTSSWK